MDSLDPEPLERVRIFPYILTPLHLENKRFNEVDFQLPVVLRFLMFDVVLHAISFILIFQENFFCPPQ